MLHRLAELDRLVRQAYADFDYKRISAALTTFMTVDLSAFYFDIRKDTLYCDPISSREATRLPDGARSPVPRHRDLAGADLPFTAEEAWLSHYPSQDGSVHLQLFPDIPSDWRDDALAEKWRKIRLVRRVVTGAIEIERAAKRIGSSLEADPLVHVSDPDLFAGGGRYRPCRGVHHVGRDAGVRRRPSRGLPAAGCQRRGGGREACRGPQMRALLEDITGGGQRAGLPRRDTARRPGTARVAHDPPPGGGVVHDPEKWIPAFRKGHAPK